MAVPTAITDLSTTAASNSPQGSDSIGNPGKIDDYFRGYGAVTRAESLNKSWERWNDTPTFISATQFSVAGDLTARYLVNRRVKCTVTAGTVYGRITASAFTTLTTVTVSLDSGNLDSGLSEVQLGPEGKAFWTTSAGLAAQLSDETGTGSAVFATSPTLVTPNIGVASGTSLSVTGQLTSTVATGTAPLAVSSTTKVTNLNVDLLDGGDWASPGNIGTTAPGTAAFTSITGTGQIDVGGGTNISAKRSSFSGNSEPYSIAAKYVSSGGAVYFGATDGTSTPGFQISNNGGGNILMGTNGGAVTAAGSLTATALIPSSSTVPSNGLYLPSANTLGWATNTTNWLNLTSDGRLYGTALHNNAGAVTGTANQYIASGTYTPTITNITNVGSSTARVTQWIRVGNIVHVAGAVEIVPTAAAPTNTAFSMSLPIASTLVNASDLGGSGARLVGGTKELAYICGSSTVAQFTFSATTTATGPLSFAFSYVVL